MMLAAATAPALVQAQALPPEEEVEHVVTAGETLGGIATRAQVPRVLIIEANRLKAPYAVRTGQRLAIPRTRRHTVVAGETGFTIAYRYGVPFSAIAVANGLAADATLRPGQRLLIPTVIAGKEAAPAAPSSTAATPTQSAAPASPATQPVARNFGWPLAGPLRRGFTSRAQANYHDGIDITAPQGTAVRASDAGKVLFAGAEPSQFGNLVVVDHGGGWTTAYAFLSRVTVKVGDLVKKGERVGLVGNTGMARGNELHFEMRRANRPIDPATQMPPRD